MRGWIAGQDGVRQLQRKIVAAGGWYRVELQDRMLRQLQGSGWCETAAGEWMV